MPLEDVASQPAKMKKPATKSGIPYKEVDEMMDVKLGIYAIPPEHMPLEARKVFFEHRERELAWEMYQTVKKSGYPCVISAREETHEYGAMQYNVTIGKPQIAHLEWAPVPPKLSFGQRLKVLLTGHYPFATKEK